MGKIMNSIFAEILYQTGFLTKLNEIQEIVLRNVIEEKKRQAAVFVTISISHQEEEQQVVKYGANKKRGRQENKGIG